jgi:hypothetical protein
MPVTTAGILWRRSVRRAEKFSSRDDDSGADGIARTMKRVIAGLDPAISMIVAGLCPIHRDDRDKPGHDGRKGTRHCKKRSDEAIQGSCIVR